MLWHSGIDKRAGEHDIGGGVDSVIRDHRGHWFSVNLENHFRWSPKHAVVMETGRKIVNEFHAPPHTRMLHIGQSNIFLFGRVLLQADVVMTWILHFGDVDLEIVPGSGLVPGVHPERVVHPLDVSNFHSGFKEATAVLRFALNGAR